MKKVAAVQSPVAIQPKDRTLNEALDRVFVDGSWVPVTDFKLIEDRSRHSLMAVTATGEVPVQDVKFAIYYAPTPSPDGVLPASNTIVMGSAVVYDPNFLTSVSGYRISEVRPWVSPDGLASAAKVLFLGRPSGPASSTYTNPVVVAIRTQCLPSHEASKTKPPE